VNLASISRETGVSAPTIKSYYQLLEDMFIGFSVSAFSESARKGVLSSPRFFFFDAGVRNAAAHIPLVRETVNAAPGPLFEHWVATQLHRVFSYRNDAKLCYFRTADGAEIDFIADVAGKLYPIEVKWTENPTVKDTRHLVRFMAEHADRCPGGYVVSRCPHTLDLGKGITAIPWWSF
jgi:predicted AAA+ superfamily ATPase